MLAGFHMAHVGPPAIGIITRDAKWLQQHFELEKDLVLTPPSETSSTRLAMFTVL
jgi:hypothetical protein